MASLIYLLRRITVFCIWKIIITHIDKLWFKFLGFEPFPEDKVFCKKNKPASCKLCNNEKQYQLKRHQSNSSEINESSKPLISKSSKCKRIKNYAISKDMHTFKKKNTVFDKIFVEDNNTDNLFSKLTDIDNTNSLSRPISIISGHIPDSSSDGDFTLSMDERMYNPNNWRDHSLVMRNHYSNRHGLIIIDHNDTDSGSYHSDLDRDSYLRDSDIDSLRIVNNSAEDLGEKQFHLDRLTNGHCTSSRDAVTSDNIVDRVEVVKNSQNILNSTIAPNSENIASYVGSTPRLSIVQSPSNSNIRKVKFLDTLQYFSAECKHTTVLNCRNNVKKKSILKKPKQIRIMKPKSRAIRQNRASRQKSSRPININTGKRKERNNRIITRTINGEINKKILKQGTNPKSAKKVKRKIQGQAKRTSNMRHKKYVSNSSRINFEINTPKNNLRVTSIARKLKADEPLECILNTSEDRPTKSTMNNVTNKSVSEQPLNYDSLMSPVAGNSSKKIATSRGVRELLLKRRKSVASRKGYEMISRMMRKRNNSKWSR